MAVSMPKCCPTLPDPVAIAGCPPHESPPCDPGPREGHDQHHSPPRGPASRSPRPQKEACASMLRIAVLLGRAPTSLGQTDTQRAKLIVGIWPTPSLPLGPELGLSEKG